MRARKRAVVAGVIVLALLAAPGAVFVVRPPVVVVTDDAFTTLYGKKRAFLRRIFLSARLLSLVKAVPAVEGAGPDLIALAAWNASKTPRAVFFPFRYEEAARRYAKDHPDVAAAVYAGRPPAGNPPAGGAPAGDAAPVRLAPDTLFDAYRAGFYAAAAALPDNPEGFVAVFHGGSVGAEEEAAFRRGAGDYRDGETAFGGEIVFAAGEAAEAFRARLQDAACAVVLDGNTAYAALAGEGRQVPLVLFTWIDPAVLPRAAFVVFDDSPWGTLPAAVSALENGGNGAVASGIHWAEKNIGKNLALRGKKLNFSPKNADN